MCFNCQEDNPLSETKWRRFSRNQVRHETFQQKLKINMIYRNKFGILGWNLFTSTSEWTSPGKYSSHTSKIPLNYKNYDKFLYPGHHHYMLCIHKICTCIIKQHVNVYISRSSYSPLCILCFYKHCQSKTTLSIFDI